MSEWHQKHFSKNGLIQHCIDSTVTIEDADNMLDQFMQKHKIKKGILAGNSIGIYCLHSKLSSSIHFYILGYDRKFLNKYCPKFTSHLHHRMVDVSTIKVLVSMWYKDKTLYNKVTEHRALSDILQSIDELRYYRSKYFKDLDPTFS